MKKMFVLLYLFLVFCMPVSAEESAENPTEIISKVIESKQKVVDEEIQDFLSAEGLKLEGRIQFENELFLDTEGVYTEELLFTPPKKLASHSVLTPDLTTKLIEKRNVFDYYAVNEYSISPEYSETEHQLGNYTFGTTYGTDMDVAQLEYRTSFYSRYDTKRFAFTAAYGKDAYTTSGKQMDNISFSPEWKISKGFVLKESSKFNTFENRQRHKLSLQYSPKIKNERGRLNFEADINQYIYEDGSHSYSVGFFTKIKL